MSSFPAKPAADTRAPAANPLLLAAADIKLSHSIFALPFAVLGAFLARPVDAPWPRFGGQLALVVMCMVIARTWAMVVNRLADRDIDARVGRTRGRPIVAGRVKPVQALIFGIVLGVIAAVQLWITVNGLAAALSVLGLLGYVLLYSAWLKRRTPQNIVIGGVAGAIPPLVGWAAAAGSLSVDALFPFLVIFLWTPPHFWALALLISDDYEKTGIPMMPVVRGEEYTRNRILLYTVLLVAFTLVPVATGFFGGLYLAAAAILGALFLGGSIALLRSPSRKTALQLHLGSLAYLFLLFGAMAADRVLAA